MTRKHFIKTLVGLNHRIHAEGLAKGSVRNINYNGNVSIVYKKEI